MAANPHLNEREWKRIAAVLPPSRGVGRPRSDDRQAVAELLYAEVLTRTCWVAPALQTLYGRPRAGFLSMRRQRWREDGTWPKVIAAAAPALDRMHERELRSDGRTDMARLMRQYDKRWDAIR